MNIPLDFEREGFDGVIVIKNGKFNGGISHPSDMDKEEWKIIKKSMDLHIKTVNQLEKLQLKKPKDAHVKAWITIRGKCFAGEKK